MVEDTYNDLRKLLTKTILCKQNIQTPDFDVDGTF